MKKIEAIIRPEVFAQVREGLALEGIDGLSISEIAGAGRQEGKIGLFRGNSFSMEFSQKLKLEMVVDNAKVQPIIDVLLRKASTGEVGDGKIFIYPVEQAIRIRTKELGSIAID